MVRRKWLEYRCVLMAGLTGFPDGLNTEYERKKELQNDSEVYSLRHNQLREQGSSCGSWERREEKQSLRREL